MNKIPESLKHLLRNFEWSPNNVIDLHEKGVHYFDHEFLPTTIDVHTHATMNYRGLTQPNALPRYFPEDVHHKIEDWYNCNFFRLQNGGIHHLGSELNLNPIKKWGDSKLKILMIRLSDYEVVDGGFGHYLVSEFIQDFDDNIFIDYGFLPPREDLSKYFDAEIPLIFGNITKRPMQDFDVVAISHCWPPERILLPSILVNSGLPLYYWERWDEELPYYEWCPLILIAGMGAAYLENLAGCNPVKGTAQNSFFDVAAIGEGELVGLKFFQEMYQTFEEGGSKKDFLKKLTNEKHTGIYDPTKVVFEYQDKVHITRDYTGKELDRQTWKSGGKIHRISLVDDENKVAYTMAGPGSEEFEDLEEVQQEFVKRYLDMENPLDRGKE